MVQQPQIHPGSAGAVGQEPRAYMDVFQLDVSAGIFCDCSEILVALLSWLKLVLYGASGDVALAQGTNRVNLWCWVRRPWFGSCSPFYKTRRSSLHVSLSTLLEASAPQRRGPVAPRTPPGGHTSGNTQAVRPGAGQHLRSVLTPKRT